MAIKPIPVALVDNDVWSTCQLRIMLTNHDAPLSVLWVADSGEAGVAKLEKSDKVPRVMLVDLMMEDMPGSDFAALVHERHPKMGVVGVTSFSVDASEPWRSNMDVIVHKERSCVELVHAVGKVAKRKDVGSPNSKSTSSSNTRKAKKRRRSPRTSTSRRTPSRATCTASTRNSTSPTEPRQYSYADAKA